MKKSQDKNFMSTKRAFEVKQKTFFIIFKGLLAAKNCIRPESAPLIILKIQHELIPWMTLLP